MKLSTICSAWFCRTHGLFEGTVRENLVYNMEGISDESLERVCKACGLDKFVHTLPEGFDTVLSESVAISAGQKQLLTIARAMSRMRLCFILDEATSSVDTRTELLIQRARISLQRAERALLSHTDFRLSKTQT